MLTSDCDIMVSCDYGAGLVVPDVPLEETEILRNEAAKHGIELASPSISFIVFITLLYPYVLILTTEALQCQYLQFFL
jgi:hypothetical protein